MYYHVVRFCHGRIRTGMYSVGLQLAHDDDAIDTMATKRQVKMILKKRLPHAKKNVVHGKEDAKAIIIYTRGFNM